MAVEDKQWFTTPSVTSEIPGSPTTAGFNFGDWLGGNVGSLINFGSSILNYVNDKNLMAYKKDLQNKIFEREDNAIQRRVADLKAAGLNPLLAAGQGAGTGQETSVSSPHMNQVNIAEKLAIQTAKQQLMQQQYDTVTAKYNSINAYQNWYHTNHEWNIEQNVHGILESMKKDYDADNIDDFFHWLNEHPWMRNVYNPEVLQRLKEYNYEWKLMDSEFRYNNLSNNEAIRHMTEERDFYNSMPGSQYGLTTMLRLFASIFGMGTNAVKAAGSFRKREITNNHNYSYRPVYNNMY